ncbi:B12-binding domain-containing radical SAM protein [Patescibacteria group bacterium]|nr:B12-binding domain-containing radical SAM protein [Patescibacteria group bacterium]
MLKVLLIDPPFPERPWDIKWLTQFPPKGLMYIAAYLRNAGVKVDILDTKQMQYERPSLLSRSIEEIQQFVKYYIEEHKPDIIGITSTTISYIPATKIVKAAKEAAPNAIVVIGGVHVTFMAHETLNECPWIDAVIRGEGERSIFELSQGKPFPQIQNISYRNGEEIVDNPIGPLLSPEEIPIPAYDMLDMSKYTYVVLMCTRGCPHNCTFCELPLIHGRVIRCRPSDKISQELELALSLNPKLEIRYEDEFMGLYPERTKQVLDVIKSKNVGQFRAATRPDGITEDILKKLKEAGCTNLYIGMESGSDEVLKFNKRAITVSKILEIAEMFLRNEMLFHAGFILGLPGETKQTLEQTLDIALKCCDATFPTVKKNFKELLGMMSFKLIVENSRAEFNLLAPNPGTEIFRNPEKFRYKIFHKNWELYDCNTSVGEPYDVSAPEIEEFKKKAFKAVQDKMKKYNLPVNWWDYGYKG